MKNKLKKYYAVKIGRKSLVIVNSWKECYPLVNGFEGAIFRSFKTLPQAEGWLLISNIIDNSGRITVKKSRWKGVEYSSFGVRHANFGRSVGEFYIPYTGDPLIPPWDTNET